jgi:hypothetical protein
MLIGAGVLVVVLSLVAVGMACTARPSAEPWNPTPTPTTPPTATEEGPTPTPTPWYEGMVSPTPEPTPAYPAWWTDQMTQDEEGRWWPPDEVIEMVREDYQTYMDEVYALTAANDLEGVIESLPRWYTGDSLAAIEVIYAEVESGERAFGIMVWEDTLIQVQDFSEDGLECTLGLTTRNGTSRRWVDGEFVEGVTNPGGLYLWRMRYDPTDGRWKMAEFIEYYPAEGGGG